MFHVHVFTVQFLTHQPQFRLLSHPSPDPNVLHARRLEVLEVLLERGFVKLRQELRLNGDVEASDVVDDLTFGHEYNTFEKESTVQAVERIRPPAKIGQRLAPT